MSSAQENRGRGTVCTFYSYKGGVGRTLTLANVAVLLAQWGYRVLCIDWDLEAPGLHLYYGNPRPNRGLVELIEGVDGGRPLPWQDHTLVVREPQVEDRLRLMPAGLMDDGYYHRMQALDWDALYKERALGEALEVLRAEWVAEFDFVLIDSRTGVTDIGGICTVQLPDIIAFLLTPNEQNVAGSLDIMRRAQAQRNELPVDLSKLLCLPIVTRWEANVELELARRWLTRLQEALVPWFAGWAHKSLEPGDLLNHTRLPYVPRWSFGEDLPVIEEGTSDQFSLGYGLETLAALIANRLEQTDLLVANRNSYVDNARFAKATDRDRFEYDARMLFQQSDARFASELTKRLRRRNWRISPIADPLGETTGEVTRTSARNLVVVLSEMPSPALDQEMREFVRRMLVDDEDWRLLIPITRAPATEVMPRPLRGLQVIDASDESEDVVATRVSILLEQQRLELLDTSLGPRNAMTVRARAHYALALNETDDPAALAVIARAARDAREVLGENNVLTRTLMAAGQRYADAEERRRSPDWHHARLIALEMALESESRESIDEALSDRFELDEEERKSVLDDVYRRLGPSS